MSDLIYETFFIDTLIWWIDICIMWFILLCHFGNVLTRKTELNVKFLSLYSLLLILQQTNKWHEILIQVKIV